MSSQTTRYPFNQVDVFTNKPYYGNPVAVVNCLDPHRLIPTQEQMQRFARWTNLSETTFLLPPSAGTKADYRLKIFTPAEELAFAGHPTLGSCRAFLHALGSAEASRLLAECSGELVQECKIGLVSLQVSSDGSTVRFLAPDFLRYGPVDSSTVARFTKALCLDPADILDTHHIDNGPRWIGVKLKSAASVLKIDVNAPSCDIGSIRDLCIGFIGPYHGGKTDDGELVANEVRAFDFGEISEDPVTGSLNAGFAKWLESTGDSPADQYTNSQGTAIQRQGRISVKIDRSKGKDSKPEIWIGGSTVICIEGVVHI